MYALGKGQEQCVFGGKENQYAGMSTAYLKNKWGLTQPKLKEQEGGIVKGMAAEV